MIHGDFGTFDNADFDSLGGISGFGKDDNTCFGIFGSSNLWAVVYSSLGNGGNLGFCESFNFGSVGSSIFGRSSGFGIVRTSSFGIVGTLNFAIVGNFGLGNSSSYGNSGFCDVGTSCFGTVARQLMLR
ncbi:hypothetical protein Fot_28799 [Forsythia ovata]|uniref:Uncharacterized protein n=1 Tax=Forsythia ovata TaxID=205694 RepID=A0ABD1TQ21_9LAMI